MNYLALTEAQSRLLVAVLVGVDRSKFSREQGVELDELIEAVQVQPDLPLFGAAAKAGATLGGLAKSVGVPKDSSPFAGAAQAIILREGFARDDIELDDHVVVARSPNGAWVSGWLHVSNDAAGVETDVCVLLDSMLDRLDDLEVDLLETQPEVEQMELDVVANFIHTNGEFLTDYEPLEDVLSEGPRFEFGTEKLQKPYSEVMARIGSAALAAGHPAIEVETLELWLEMHGEALNREVAASL